MQTPKQKYNTQRGDALKRKDFNGNLIEWKLTFDEWFLIWQQSGHWEERGNRKDQYCLSRKNDIGHYEMNNVFVQLHSDNISQARKAKPLTPEIYKVIGEKNKGQKRSKEFCERLSITRIGEGNPNHKSKKFKVME